MPGQDTALLLRNTIGGGRSAGIRTAFGVVGGLAVWAVASTAGLAALVIAPEPAFVAIKILGAVYLVLLGVQALRPALHGHPAPTPTQPTNSSWAG